MLRRMYATNIKIEKLNINRKESGLCLCLLWAVLLWAKEPHSSWEGCKSGMTSKCPGSSASSDRHHPFSKTVVKQCSSAFLNRKKKKSAKLTYPNGHSLGHPEGSLCPLAKHLTALSLVKRWAVNIRSVWGNDLVWSESLGILCTPSQRLWGSLQQTERI